MNRYNGKHIAEAAAQQSTTKKRMSGKQKGLIALCIVLALAVGAVAAYKMVFVKPELPTVTEEQLAEEETVEGLQPRVSGARKSQDYYTILLLGRDTGGGGNCDTMMLVSYDVTNQKMTVLSIPRDTMVNVPWDVKKINSVYNVYGGGDKGINKLKTEIAQLVGFEPDYTVIVEWEAVGKLVDAIGGVYYDVPRKMDYDDPLQDLSIHIKSGYQLLDGETAMGVVRFREGANGYANGDIGRIETQQGFLKAVAQQVLQVQNVTKIQQFAKIFEENVTTELSVQNLFWFGKSAIIGGLNMDNITFVTMPYDGVSCWSRTYHNYQSYVTPRAEELLDLVNTSVSPFVEESTLADLDIMSVNANGSISSTTGRVEDTRASSAPSVSSGVSKTPVDNDTTASGAQTGGTSHSGGSTGSSGSTNHSSGGTATGESTFDETGESGGLTGTEGETGAIADENGGTTAEGEGGGTTGETGGATGGETGGTTGETGQAGSTGGATTTPPAETGGGNGYTGEEGYGEATAATGPRASETTTASIAQGQSGTAKAIVEETLPVEAAAE